MSSFRALARLAAPACVCATLTAPALAVSPLAPSTGFALYTRYEYLDGPLRPGTRGDDRIFGNRAELRLGRAFETDTLRFGAQLEIWDARAWFHDSETPLNTGEVNALEPVNAWLSVDLGGGTLRAGRLTQNLGSRRLVARNLYRATTNGFTGVDWRGDLGAWRVQTLFYSPDARRPDERDRVSDDDVQLDETSFERRFWGVFAERDLTGRDRLEFYAFHLDENDTKKTPSRDRRITTPGLRWLRTAPDGGLDAELEIALQFGKVRGTAAPMDRRDLDHRAAMLFGELGWRPGPSAPRTSLELLWASGDDDPADGDSGTFDSLFGVIVGDYGPSGIWTSLNRRNLFTAVLRIEGRPLPRVRAHALLRHARLAAAEDAWYATGLRDSSGASGNAIGDQFETRVRWWAIEEKLQIETGWIHHRKGRFARRAPGTPGDDAVNYIWFSTRIIL